MRDFAKVSDVEAARALKAYKGLVESLIGLYPFHLRDDLRADANVAVIEAISSFKAAKGVKESTWVYRIVSWRLPQAAKAVNGYATFEGLDEGQLADTHDTSREMEHTLAMRAVGKLPLRQGIIISAQLRGESLAEIAGTLGISTPRTFLEGKSALRNLRKLLENSEALEETPVDTVR